jgi:hypothetical protein
MGWEKQKNLKTAAHFAAAAVLEHLKNYRDIVTRQLTRPGNYQCPAKTKNCLSPFVVLSAGA